MSLDKWPIPVLIDAEDALLAELGARLLKEFGGKYSPEGVAQIWRGKSKMDKKIPGWNRGAPYTHPRLVLRDLDSCAPPDDMKNCPASETARLLGKEEKSPNLLLRFAVVEAESWLLADCDALAEFLDVKEDLRITSADAEENPKKRLIALAGKSRQKEIRKGIPPDPNNGRKIGPAYNAHLTDFVIWHWNPKQAAKRSKSLRQTLDRLAKFPDGV